LLLPGTLRLPVYRLYQLAWSGLDWLYPPQCGGCGVARSRWCEACQQEVRLVPETICQSCGQILVAPGVCNQCRDIPPPYVAMRAWAVFGGSVRNALHHLKYGGDMALGEVLARNLISIVQNSGWQVDLVTAVPLGVARRKERGYNQAALLAFPLALACGIPYQSKALEKIRQTRTQVGLDNAERHKNVSGAFQARHSVVAKKRVLVVDDVTTSGATIHACSESLLAAGALQVYGLTLARAVLTPA
jgi:competence protein ComFC